MLCVNRTHAESVTTQEPGTPIKTFRITELIANDLMQLHRPRSSLEHHLVHEYLTFDDGINHNCLVVCAIIQAQTWQVGAQALAMDKQNEMVAQKT